MAQKIRIKRGLKINLPEILDVGELAYCTDTKELFIGTYTGNQLIKGVQNLSGLTDVDLVEKINGYVLTYNSNTDKFEPKALPAGNGSGATNLDGLTDVDISSNVPVDGDVLKFQAGVWKASANNSSSGSMYIIELSQWGIKQGLPTKPYVTQNYIDANNNITGINNAIQYAYNNGFTEVALPKGDYAICYPNKIIINRNGMTINFMGSTLKVIYDSDNKSPFDTADRSALLDYYNFGGISIAFEGAKGSKIINLNLIGCRADRSFTNLASERAYEHSYGIMFSKGTSHCKVSYCTVTNYMGDGISVDNTSLRDYGEFDMGLTFENLDTNTGLPISTTNTLITKMLTIPTETATTYDSVLIGGAGYSRQTYINGKELGMFFYKDDGTFIKASLNKKIYTPITIPVGAKKYRMVFYNESSSTSLTKNYSIVLRFGQAPHHNIIEHNEVYACHRGGITLGGSYNVIQHNIIRDIGLDYYDGKPIFNDPTRYAINQEDSYGDNCVVRNNLIYGTYQGLLVGCYSVQVENNHFYNVPLNAINIYSTVYTNVKGNFIYNCGNSIGLMDSHFQSAIVMISQNTMVGGTLNLTNAITGSYDVVVKNNFLLNPTSVSLPDSDKYVFLNNNVSFSSLFTGSSTFTVNRIEGCTFEGKVNQTNLVLKAYEIDNSNFINLLFTPQTRNTTTIREKVKIRNSKFSSTIIENHVYNQKQRTVEISNSKLTDTIIKNGNTNTVGEDSITNLKNCDIFIKNNTYLLQSNLNSSTVYGSSELSECKIEISNSGFLHLVNNLFTLSTSVYTLALKKCELNYTGVSPLSLVYYSTKGVMKNLISYNNKYTNITLPTSDEKYIGYDPNIQSLTEPTTGYFFAGNVMNNPSPTAGGYLGWVCTTGGVANNNPWASGVSYTIGQQVNANNKVYECTVAGASGSTAPSHTSGTALDGSILTWKYVDVKAAFKQYGLISN